MIYIVYYGNLFWEKSGIVAGYISVVAKKAVIYFGKRVALLLDIYQLLQRETAHSPSKRKDKHGFIISQCKHTDL